MSFPTNRYTYAWCKIIGFEEDCGAANSKGCPLRVEAQTVGGDGKKNFAKSWSPPQSKSIYADESKTIYKGDMFACCPVNDCCGFAKDVTTPAPKELAYGTITTTTTSGGVDSGGHHQRGIRLRGVEPSTGGGGRDGMRVCVHATGCVTDAM